MDSILYETKLKTHYVAIAVHGYEVYKNESGAATRVAIVGYKGQKGLAMAISESDRREQLKQEITS